MEPLDMDRFLDRGEFYVERSALARRRADINLSGMLLDNAVTHGKTEAGAAAAGFGGEKRIKDAMNVLAGDASARVRDFDFDASVMRCGPDFEHSSTGHGISCVQKQVQENLLQLVGGSANGRQRF